MPLHRRIALALFWVTPVAEVWLALRMAFDWELPMLAGMLLAIWATIAQQRQQRRAAADVAVALGVTVWAALAMGCLLAAGAASATVLLPALGALAFAFLFLPAMHCAFVSTGIAITSCLPWFAGTATPEAGFRSVLVVAVLMVLSTLRRREIVEVSRPRLRMSILRRGSAEATRYPDLLLRAERRTDGALAMGLALASVPPSGMRIRILPR